MVIFIKTQFLPELTRAGGGPILLSMFIFICHHDMLATLSMKIYIRGTNVKCTLLTFIIFKPLINLGRFYFPAELTLRKGRGCGH